MEGSEDKTGKGQAKTGKERPAGVRGLRVDGDAEEPGAVRSPRRRIAARAVKHSSL